MATLSTPVPPLITILSWWSLPVLLFIYGLSVVVYRLYLHPLAKFPGPKLAASTKWYEFYYDVIKSPGGQFFYKLSEMHDIYGPIVRLNPSEIHIRDPTFFDTLYAPNPTVRHKYPPSTEMAGLPFGTHGTVDHYSHKQRRMANSRMFSKRAVASAQDLIHGHIEKLVKVFESKVGNDEPVDLQTTFLAYTTDVIYHYMFNIQAGYQDNPEAARGWRHSMEAVAQATPFSKQFPWLNANLLLLPPWLLQPLLKRVQPDLAGLLNAHKLMREIVSSYTKTRKSEKSFSQEGDETKKVKPETIFHSIDESSLPPAEKTPLRLYQEGLTVLFAGGETGSRLLAHTIFHLLDNPEVMSKVKGEIEGAIGDSGRVPDVKVLETLPWLTASVRESLRLRAATTSRLPLVLNQDLQYKEWVIPAGTPVSMSHGDILHNDEIFPEAMKFKPERWFNPTDFQKRMYVPFGKGTRMCIGVDFAYIEMYISLATILSRFELELFDTNWERDVKYSRDCFLGESRRDSPGIRVKVVADKMKLPGGL
ncbi:cytochrome P450 [Xylaria sp. FL0043]|nr:cytochrome P450 [Xylaria sp. FL0043]